MASSSSSNSEVVGESIFDSEVIPSSLVQEIAQATSSSTPASGSSRLLRMQTTGNLGESIFDSEGVPSSLVHEIVPILGVANEVEASNPRVAYLCRLHGAFEKAHRLDPTSSGCGVRQFKTALLQRLERENHATLKGRVEQSDAREMQRFYRQYYINMYIQALQNAADTADCAQLTKAYQTAAVLFEVLKAVNVSQEIGVDQAISETRNQVEEKEKLYIPEIRAAFDILCNARGLPWPKDHEQKADADLFEWLQAVFVFQLDDHALHTALRKLLKNYIRWCKYLGRKNSLWLPIVQQEVQQRKILYMGLYLLIWGEAGNLRFMPECLWYLYHHMAFELYGVLAGIVSPITGENVTPAYGGEEGAFLKKVVTPITKIIETDEAERNKAMKLKHSHRRNYDDLNAYFWSRDCFRLGWPMRADADFFKKRCDLCELCSSSTPQVCVRVCFILAKVRSWIRQSRLWRWRRGGSPSFTWLSALDS